MTLPPHGCTDCLKGVPSDEYVFGDSVDWTLFNPQPLEEPKGWEGSSVNWILDNGALHQLLMQLKKDDSFQFKSGAVRIPRELIDAIIKRYGADYFGYELRAENSNHYHGHLLFFRITR